MGTMSMMKQVVNETGAYVLQQGQRKFEGAELAEMKDSAILFDELLMATKEGVTLTGIETINGKDTYAIKGKKQRSIMM
jgi:hypothetical protein